MIQAQPPARNTVSGLSGIVGPSLAKHSSVLPWVPALLLVELAHLMQLPLGPPAQRQVHDEARATRRRLLDVRVAAVPLDDPAHLPLLDDRGPPEQLPSEGVEGDDPGRERGAAVVDQRTVDADVAGIAFALDTATGSRRGVTISAAYGLGEGLVGEISEWLAAPQRQRLLERGQ